MEKVQKIGNSAPAKSGYYWTRWLFLRALGLVYLTAFCSLGGQIIGLVGEHGILPAHKFLDLISAHQDALQFGFFPTLFWFNASDAALSSACLVGCLLSILALLGAATGFSLLLCWILFLSLVNIGQDFLSFQWDILLLEAGFLAIFLAPWQWLEPPWKIKFKQFNWTAPKVEPSIIVIWLLRWLLFRLMFESGFVKLASGDPTWRDLTALNYHYLTQPLPTPIAWYVAQLPVWFNKFSVCGVFVIELLVPFLIFAGRRARLMAACILVFFQILIAVTGNYAFFNLLAVALCILLLDDQFIRHCWRRIRAMVVATKQAGLASFAPTGVMAVPRAQKISCIVVAVVIGFLSVGTCLRGIIGLSVPEPVEKLFNSSSSYFLCNNYGLFAVMTTRRLEIQIEGSYDGLFWLEYDFKYKPGDLAKALPVVAPFQPRLDWQMWFAALSDFRNNPWFLNFVFRLLQGEKTVLSQLAHNPFPDGPPKYIRARLYDYQFTNETEHKKDGNWWKRELVGEYLDPVSLDERSKM